MIIFAIVACYMASLTQCGAVYDRVNVYHDMKSCQMRAEQMRDELDVKFDTDPKFGEKLICLDWKKKDKKGIVPFLMMMEGQPHKQDANYASSTSR